MAVKKIFLFKNFIITIPISNHRRISRNIDFDQNGGVPTEKQIFVENITLQSGSEIEIFYPKSITFGHNLKNTYKKEKCSSPTLNLALRENHT